MVYLYDTSIRYLIQKMWMAIINVFDHILLTLWWYTIDVLFHFLKIQSFGVSSSKINRKTVSVIDSVMSSIS